MNLKLEFSANICMFVFEDSRVLLIAVHAENPERPWCAGIS